MLETSPVAAFTDAVQARDVNRLVGLLAPDVKLSVPPMHYTRRGAQDVIDALVGLLYAFGELRYQLRGRYVAPGSVTDEVIFMGRQTGPFLGAGPQPHVSAVAARLIMTHDEATVTGISVWPDLSALRAAVGGASRIIDLTKVGDAGAVVASLRAAMPPAQTKLIIGTTREERVAVAAPHTDAETASEDPRPLAGRAVPKPPVTRTVRRRRAVAAGAAMLAVSTALTLWVGLGALRQPSGAGPTGAVPRPATTSPPVGAGQEGSRPPDDGAESAGQAGVVITNADGLPPARLPAGETTVTYRNDKLFFDFGKYALRPEALRALEGVIRDARAQHRQGRVLVIGYTDDRGTHDYNLRLSRQRAAAVAAVLKTGLAHTGMNVAARGLGEEDPAATNRTEAGRQANRRVVITFPAATHPSA